MNRPPDEEVQNIVMLANLSEALHVLPWQGGLFDQHPYYVIGINAVLAARAERQEREHKTASKGARHRS